MAEATAVEPLAGFDLDPPPDVGVLVVPEILSLSVVDASSNIRRHSFSIDAKQSPESAFMLSSACGETANL